MEYIKIGATLFENVLVPVNISLKNSVHWLLCGGSGSGKSVLTLYILNQLKKYATDIFIADFKNTKDYENITPHYAVGMECISLFQEFYKKYEAIKNGEEKGKIWFVWDEMAGNLIWLESQDKKLAQDIKNKMGEILMMGRELNGKNGEVSSAGIFSILQRPDASHYMVGSRENYHVKILMGLSSIESRKMMGYSTDEIPKDFKGGIGKGLLLTNDMPLPIAFIVPKIDKARLIQLLQKKGSMGQ